MRGWQNTFILNYAESQVSAPNVHCLINKVCRSLSWQASCLISAAGQQKRQNPWSSLLLVTREKRTDGPHPTIQAPLSSKTVLQFNNRKHSQIQYLHPNALMYTLHLLGFSTTLSSVISGPPPAQCSELQSRPIYSGKGSDKHIFKMFLLLWLNQNEKSILFLLWSLYIKKCFPRLFAVSSIWSTSSMDFIKPSIPL